MIPVATSRSLPSTHTDQAQQVRAAREERLTEILGDRGPEEADTPQAEDNGGATPPSVAATDDPSDPTDQVSGGVPPLEHPTRASRWSTRWPHRPPRPARLPPPVPEPTDPAQPGQAPSPAPQPPVPDPSRPPAPGTPPADPGDPLP